MAKEDTVKSAAELLALDAEDRIQSAPTQDEREYWQRMADYWWSQVSA